METSYLVFTCNRVPQKPQLYVKQYLTACSLLALL